MEIEINKSFDTLIKGGIILYPTDTVWGLGCDATKDNAIDKIIKLKGRNNKNGFIILLDEPSKLNRYVKLVPYHAWDIIEYSKNPLTIIYPEAIGLSNKVLANDSSVAIRIVKNKFCQRLIQKLNKPIVSTSANISGCNTPLQFKQISTSILNAVDYIVNLPKIDFSGTKPSTIIKMELNGEIKIVRK